MFDIVVGKGKTPVDFDFFTRQIKFVLSFCPQFHCSDQSRLALSLGQPAQFFVFDRHVVKVFAGQHFAAGFIVKRQRGITDNLFGFNRREVAVTAGQVAQSFRIVKGGSIRLSEYEWF